MVGPKIAPGEILVRFKQGTSLSKRQSLHAAMGARLISESTLVQGLNRVQLPFGTSVARMLRQYRQDATVLYAEPNYIVHAVVSPNDQQFPTQWNMQNTGQWGGEPGADIHATQAWGITTGSSSVVVAVIDTGMDYTHPDLGANVWTAPQSFSVAVPGGTVTCPAGSRGFNMVAESCDPFDDYGHGTHVSGIIGAIGNNGVGVAGVDWQVQILPCKFLDSTGSGTLDDAIACLGLIKSLKDSGIPIIATNNSWGGPFSSQALTDAIAAQAADGILFVAAAGNGFSDNDVAFAAPSSIFSSNVISVAATTNLDLLAGFSNVGAHSVHLGAPGQEILSTVPGNSYASLSGTSMAAPQVTGVAALLRARNPSLDWRSIRNLILAGADPVPGLTTKTVTGSRLNAYGSLTCSNSTVQRRLQPTMEVIPATAGRPVLLAATDINCASPAGPVQVTVQPGGQQITLADNGQSPDQSAGDGIYTGKFTPTSVNNYTIAFAWGDAVQVEVLKNYTVGETAYNYRNVAGTSLNLGDDAVGIVNAPFPVHYGGATFNKLYVSSNGTLSFTNAFDDFIPERIPVGYWQQVPINPPPPLIYQPVATLVAPWWQDLAPVPNSNNNVFWDLVGTAPNRELVIEWRDVPGFECARELTSTVKFQVVLSESSDNITFNYTDAHFGGACADGDFGAGAEIGMQVSQTAGSEWSSGGQTLNDGFALLWSIPPPNAPPNPTPTITSITPSNFMAGDPVAVVTLTGNNFIPSSQVQLYPFQLRPTTYISSTKLQFLLNASDLAYHSPQIQVNVINPPPGGGGSNAVYFKVNSPTPQIASITPSSAAAGSYGFVLTVQGTGFVAPIDLLWEKLPGSSVGLQSTVVSSTLVTGIVPYYLLTDPGPIKVYLQGALTSNKVSFTVTSPAGAIIVPPSGLPARAGSPTQLGGGETNPKSLAPPLQFLGWKETAKLGMDYLRHFLRTRADLARDVSPLRMSGMSSLGSGSAQAPVSLPGFGLRPTLPADFLPAAVTAGDFNGDGRMDWAVANAGSNNIWIYLGKGDGTSQIPNIVPLRGFSPVTIAAKDMNGDGNLDLVVGEADSGVVAVLLGKGNGTFQPEKVTYVPGAPLSLAVADFDKDGHPDVVVGLASNLNYGPLAFLAGDGKGNLGLPVTHFGQVGSGAFETIAIATADLNGDGLPDIVATDLMISIDGVLLTGQFPSVGAAVYLNAGKGSFKLLDIFDPDHTSDQQPPLGHAVTALALADVDRDGCIDAVTVDSAAIASYFPGQCTGKFDTSREKTVGAGVAGAAAALVDLNGDGNIDLVVTGFPFYSATSNAVSVLLGDGTGSFSAPKIYRGQPSVYSFALADLNGDGKKDIITANEDSDSLSVYLNDGGGGFGAPSGTYLGFLTGGVSAATANAPKTNFAFADVNRDGNRDLVLFEYPPLSYQATQLAVLPGDGVGHYGSPIRSEALYSLDDVADFVVGDFRNTGYPDVLVLDYYGLSTAAWRFAELKNNGNGTFQSATFQSNFTSLWPYRMIAGDFNRDGKLDVVVVSYASAGNTNIASVVLFSGNGDGTFALGTQVQFPSSSFLTGPYINNVVGGDFNQDGNLDLLVSGNSLLSATDMNALYLLPGQGNGTFGLLRMLFNNFGYFGTADLNGDGFPDIVEIVPTVVNPPVPGPLEYAVYLSQKGGTFQPAGTYGPFPGLFTTGYLSGSLTDPVRPQMPFLVDVNGDGKPDILAYQTNLLGSFGTAFFSAAYGPTQVNVLLGNGDGTFTPTYVAFDLGQYEIPQLAADTNGDNKADLVKIDWLSATYHVVPSTVGPSFQIALVSNPVIGSNGKVRLTLALPSASGTTLQLSGMEPGIVVPATITVPAGSFVVDVPFQIGTGFNPLHVFGIQATLGSETRTAYGTQAGASQSTGFVAQLGTLKFIVLASQTTPDYGLLVASVAGYSSELTLSCQGLPAEATCQFGTNPINLGGGVIAVATVAVATPASLALGTYPFTVVISDGTITQKVSASFQIGDFSVSAPADQTILSTGFNLWSIDVNSTNGYNGEISISCNAGLPAGLSCPWDGARLSPIGNYPTYVQTQNVPTGVYQWTITGTVGSISHSGTVPLHVVGQTPQVSGSVSPSSAKIAVGASANFTVNLQSQNSSTTGSFTFNCVSPPAGVSCTFNPSQVSLSANGSSSTTLTVAVTAKPAAHSAARVTDDGRTSIFLGLSILGFVALFTASQTQRARGCAQRLARTALMTAASGVLLTLLSCGGGSASSPGPPPPPPPPPPATVTLTIQTTGPGVSTVLGSVTIQVP